MLSGLASAKGKGRNLNTGADAVLNLSSAGAVFVGRADGRDILRLLFRSWLTFRWTLPSLPAAHSHTFLRGKYFVAQNYAELLSTGSFFGVEVLQRRCARSEPSRRALQF